MSEQKLSNVKAKFDQRADSYLANYVNPRSIFQDGKIQRLQLVGRYAAQSGAKVSLDMGCGPGAGIAHLREVTGRGICGGVDVSLHMLRQAQRIAARASGLVQADVTRLPFAGQSFDFAYALGVFGYIKDYELFLREARRILKSKGIFIFNFPNKDSISRNWSMRTRIKARRFSSVPSPRLFSVADVHKILMDQGFHVMAVHYLIYGFGITKGFLAVKFSRFLGKVLDGTNFGRRLAWSCLLVAKKQDGEG